MNPELNQLRDSARQVVDGLGLAADEQEASSLLAELGWLMVSTPELLGGLGMGLEGACVLHTQLGRGLASAPFASQLLAIDAVSRSPWAEREDWLEPMMAGERRVAVSLGESSFTLEQGSDGGLKLNGSAAALPSANRASHVLIEAVDPNRMAVVAIEHPGVTLTSRPTWDATRQLSDLEAVDVALDPQCVIAEGEQALVLGQRLSIARDFALAADSVGGAEALLDMTVEYLQTRQQFGRPLALFQALKHRCADMKTQIEAAQALLQDTLDSVADADGDVSLTPHTRVKALASKQLACAAYASVAEEALQLHGGIGMTSEHDCHLFLKRALLNEHLGRGRVSYEQGLADLFIEGLT